MTTLFINGKFTAQRTTGVQRMASCNIEALDREIAAGATPGVSWVLLCPPSATPPALRAIEVRKGGPTRGGLHAWEQFWLPLASRSGALVSLSGSGPLLRSRQVFTIHDVAILEWPKAYRFAFRTWYTLLARAMGRRALRVLTVSSFSRDRIAALLPMDPTRIAVSHLGCEHFLGMPEDEGAWRRLELEGHRYLLAVASRNPTKNLAGLIEAFQAVPDPELRLVLVGGDNSAVFAGDTGDSQDPRILNTGPISDRELKCLYGRAAALVFPSLYEGFGLPPVEAMTCGCPVLAARAASIPEVCAEAAHYFDPVRPDDIRLAITELLDGIISREDLVHRGRQRAAELTWTASARRLLALFRSLNLVPDSAP